MMNKEWVAAALVLAWAILLSARVIGASIYGEPPQQPYAIGLDHQGPHLLICAWGALIAAVALLLVPPRARTPDN